MRVVTGILGEAVRGLAIAITIAGLAGCTPDFGKRLSLLDSPRVLAIAAVPAEQAPLQKVRFELLFASPDGAAAPRFDWAFCEERKPLSEPGAVAPDCLRPEGDSLAPLGEGVSVESTLPKDACRVFGPDPPEPTAGQPAGRAADPDPSGGYYQPVRVWVSGGGSGGETGGAADREGGDTYVTGAVRIACGLPGATPDQALEMTRRYRPNERPALRSLALVRGGSEETVAPDTGAGSPAVTVAPGEAITWRAVWDACPTSPVCGDGVCGDGEDLSSCPADCTSPRGCAGAEPYVFFDPDAREVRDRREALQISWYATAGAFEHDRTGRSEEEASQSDTENGWTAPDQAGDVTLWAVLRDDRGGVGWERYRVRVGP
jgi:hypothetical protein